MKALSRIGVAAVVLLGGGLLTAGEGTKVGDKAPAFEGKDESGKVWKSADVVGKKILVVYFYPADFTGGCTAQACAFRDNFETIKGKDVVVVGVSGDSVKTHKLFKDHHNLPFTLLADEDGAIARKLGVPTGKGGTVKHKDKDGTVHELVRGVTTQRYTVVIDKAGNIAAHYKVGNAGGDSKKVIEIVEKLQK
jgi:thioredoxin-dependent peroxiredoxin